jgi:predicted GNAT superfamily acetyltransferase
MPIVFTLQQGPFDAALLHELNELAQRVFEQPSLKVEWRLSAMPDASVATARSDGRLIGFKLGYAMTEVKYYSWLGGVEAASRGNGVARRLMQVQHEWVRGCGYALLETSTDQVNSAMSRVNLQEGFAVCGTRAEPNRLQVLYLKRLRDESVC